MKLSRYVIVGVVSVLLVFISSISSIADSNNPEEVETIQVEIATPPPVGETQLSRGLASFYYTEFFARDVRKLPKSKTSSYPSFPGKPITELNHQFGKDNVFDSKTNRGVGIRMTGFLQFPEAGSYEMQALSNDGLIITLADKVIINDPKQHSDRLSNIASIMIKQPGSYPIMIEYFQRKGTATLKLFWKKPGEMQYMPIPAEAYGHAKEKM